VRRFSFLALGSLLALAATPAHAGGSEAHPGLCSILAGNSVKAQDCTIKVSANAFSATYVFEWSDGSTTVVKLSDEGNTVNGEPAQEIETPADIEAGSECFRTQTTKDIYCSKIN